MPTEHLRTLAHYDAIAFRNASHSVVRIYVEWILLVERQGSGRVDKGDTLGNQTPCAGMYCSRHEVASPFISNTRVAHQCFGHLARFETGRKRGELMDNDARSQLCHGVTKPISVEDVDDCGLDTQPRKIGLMSPERAIRTQREGAPGGGRSHRSRRRGRGIQP
jgi:hypothetical protein